MNISFREFNIRWSRSTITSIKPCDNGIARNHRRSYRTNLHPHLIKLNNVEHGDAVKKLNSGLHNM